MQCDTPRRMYDHPNNVFVAGFIGSPAMNLLEAPSSTAACSSAPAPTRSSVALAGRQGGSVTRRVSAPRT